MSGGSAPAPLLLVHGDETYLVDRDARQWLASARAACSSDLNVEVFDAPAKLEQVRRSLGEVPFLDPQRFVLIRDAPQLGERARRGAEPADVLVRALHDRSPTTSVCLVAHARVAPTNAVLRAVQELGGQVVVHASLRGRELRGWLDQRIRQRGLRLPPGGVERLLEVAGSDLGRLDMELDKVEAAALDGTRLDLPALRRLISGDGQVEMWSVVELLLSRPPGRGAAAIDALLADGRPPQYLLATLAGQLRDLLVAQEILREHPGGSSALAHRMGLPPWRAERLARQAGAVPTATVEAWLRALQRVDADVKAGRLSDADAMRTFGLRAAGAMVAAGRGPGRR